MKRPFYKYVAVMIGIALLLPVFLMNTQVIGQNPGNEPDSETLRVAADISNMTGVKVEEIIRLKENGRTWNEVLDMLRGYGAGENDEKDKRYGLLEQSGIGEDYILRLKDEGYTGEEISEARLLAERVIFQLGEITRANRLTDASPDNSSYCILLEKIDLKTAVYLMLKLKDHFDSMEEVLDEYLCALQIGVDLEQYLTDKEAYLKQKETKSMGLSNEKIITIADIEEKMLEKIRQENAQDRDFTGLETDINEQLAGEEAEDPLPQIPG